MSKTTILYIFPTIDEEDRFLVRQLNASAGTSDCLLVPVGEQSVIIGSLLRSWEEMTGKSSEYWVGSLWDVPAVRRHLKSLRNQTQSAVLDAAKKYHDELQVKGSSSPAWLGERDAEALRCFLEMLEPSNEILPDLAWREMMEVCRATVFSKGKLPWPVEVRDWKDIGSNPMARLWIPRFVYHSTATEKGSIPSWMNGVEHIVATAAHRDARGKSFSPNLTLARKLGWAIESIVPVGDGKEIRQINPRSVCFHHEERIKSWQAYLDNHIFSASELETYARSPYWYFAERALKLKPPEVPVHDLRASEVGRIAHRVLEQFFAGHMSDFEKVVAGEDRESVFAVLDRLLQDELTKQRHERPDIATLLLERQTAKLQSTLHEVIQKDLADLAQQKSPLRPRYFEWEFGKGSIPPLELNGKAGRKVRLRGRIDRIDVDRVNKTFLVIDYKTGSRKITGKDIERGTALQLPVYIQAVKELLLPDYTPIGGLFFSLSDLSKKDGAVHKDHVSAYFDFSSRSSSLMTAERWQGAMSAAVDRIHQIVESIYAAEFPLNEGICAEYCPYRDMCGCGDV